MSHGSSGAGDPGLAGVAGYAIGPPIGEGRAGTVYSGRVEGHGEAAIKVLRPTLARSRMHVERFLESARQTADLDHPAVVEIFDVGQVPGGSAYYAMERLYGAVVRELVAGKPMPWSRVRPVALELCAAIGLAHEQGHVHGALDARRCWLLPPAPGSSAERVKVTDFGIAGEGSGPEIWPAETPYRPPERRQGEPASARGDVFAIGALLHEMLTGQPPRPGDERTPPSGRFDPELGAAIQKAIARDPSRRFADAAALADAIAVFGLDGQRGAAPPPKKLDTRSPPPRRGPTRSNPNTGLDEEDVTMVRTDRKPAVGPAPSLPDLAAAAARATAARSPRLPPLPGPSSRPTPPPAPKAAAPDPTPPPLLVGPPRGAPAPKRAFQPEEAEPEDRTTLMSGGHRFQPTENTSILPAPDGPELSSSPHGRAVEVAEGGEHTVIVEFRPPAAGGASRGDTGIHVITKQPPGSPREQTAVLDMSDAPRDLAAATAILEGPSLQVMKEETQILGVDLNRLGASESAGISMTAVIEGPFPEITSGSVIVSDEADEPAASPSASPPRANPFPPPGAGGYPVAAAGYASTPAPGSGAHPAAAPPSGGYPASRPPASGGYRSSGSPVSSGGYGGPSSQASRATGGRKLARRRRSDHGMVVGVALGILLAVAILGGGIVAGLWVTSQ